MDLLVRRHHMVSPRTNRRPYLKTNLKAACTRLQRPALYEYTRHSADVFRKDGGWARCACGEDVEG